MIANLSQGEDIFVSLESEFDAELSAGVMDEDITDHGSVDPSIQKDSDPIYMPCNCNESIVPELFEIPIKLDECPICYEELKMVNFTVTRCGHTFHSSCIFNALEMGEDCPMCRTQLVALRIDDEDEDEDEEDEDDDEEDEVADEDEDDEYEADEYAPKYNEKGEIQFAVTHEQMTNKLINMGYTTADLFQLYIHNRLQNETNKYTSEFRFNLTKDINAIAFGYIKLSNRDKRSYADVVKK